MFKKIKNIFYIISFLSFIVAITYFYFSDTNISRVNKTRSIYPSGLISEIQDLQILENDTIQGWGSNSHQQLAIPDIFSHSDLTTTLIKSVEKISKFTF